MGRSSPSKRAVVVRNAEALKGDGEELAGYLDDPTPGVTLVLLAAKPDKRTKVWKRVLEKAAVTPADPPKGAACAPSSTRGCGNGSCGWTRTGVVELVERVGQDLRRLMGEIDKLEAFASGGGKATLSADDVAAVMGRGMAQPLYKLARRLCRRARRRGPRAR